MPNDIAYPKAIFMVSDPQIGKPDALYVDYKKKLFSVEPVAIANNFKTTGRSFVSQEELNDLVMQYRERSDWTECYE